MTSYSTLQINGRYYNREALLGGDWLGTDQPKSNWHGSFKTFMLEWLDDKDFVIVKTSGSTGKPKQIRLFKERMVNSAKMTGQYFGFKQNDTALLCLPCDYIAGKMMIVRAFVWGMNLIPVTTQGNPLVEVNQNIDFAAMVPLQVTNVFEQSPNKFSFIKRLIIGGGKVDKQLLEKLQEINTDCYATYGMTETITHVAIKKLNKKNRSHYFEGLGNIFFSKDDRGCLVIQANHLAEKPVITNDLVQLKDTQAFEWLGRIDNVINTGGIKVFPEKIENQIADFLAQRFIITSLPDKKLENKVILLIEDTPWTKQKIKMLTDKLRSILSKFELPKEIHFLTSFIETPTKKIQRNQTKAELIKFIF